MNIKMGRKSGRKREPKKGNSTSECEKLGEKMKEIW